MGREGIQLKLQNDVRVNLTVGLEARLGVGNTEVYGNHSRKIIIWKKISQDRMLWSFGKIRSESVGRVSFMGGDTSALL